MNSTEFKKKKINVFLILGLFLALSMSSYVVFSTNADYNHTESEIKRLSAEEKKNDAKMQENPMYKRLNAYGLGLGTIGNILKYKDASPVWYELLRDIAREIPKNITIKSLQYSPEKKVVTMNIIATDRKRLTETLSLLEDLESIERVDFDGIKEEKITLNWEKVQYSWFSVNIRADIDEEYLKLKYGTAETKRAEKYKVDEEKGEKETPEVSEANPNDATGSLSPETWTWSSGVEWENESTEGSGSQDR